MPGLRVTGPSGTMFEQDAGGGAGGAGEQGKARSPIDQILDLLVYAPLGLALSASEELPRLAEKGRQELAGQVPTARAVGAMALSQGQKRVERMARLAAERLADLGLVTEPGGSQAASAKSPPGSTTSRATSPEPGAQGPVDGAPTASPPDVGRPAGAAPSAASLAIPGYDALSASQVVQRLAGLAPEELDAVRAYESATRRRKTILTRIAQLQAS